MVPALVVEKVVAVPALVVGDDFVDAINSLIKALGETGEGLVGTNAQLISLQNGIQSTGDEGGFSQAGRGVSDVLNESEQLKALEHTFMDVNTTGEAVALGFNNMRTGVMTQFENSIKQINTDLVSFGQSLGDVRNARNTMMNFFRENANLSSTGISTQEETFMDTFTTTMGLFTGELKDSNRQTGKLIQTALDKSLYNPLTAIGTDITNVSNTLRGTRDDLKELGFDSNFRMSFDDMNESMLRIYELQRRSGVMGGIRDSENKLAMTREFMMLEIIARNTGKTVDQLLEANHEDNRSLSNLSASGVITKTEQENMQRAMAYLKETNRSGFADLILEIARSGGGRGGISKFLADNPEDANAFAASGNIEELYALIRSFSKNNEFQQQERLDFLNKLKDQQQITGTLERERKELVKANEVHNAKILDRLNDMVGSFDRSTIESATASTALNDRLFQLIGEANLTPEERASSDPKKR